MHDLAELGGFFSHHVDETIHRLTAALPEQFVGNDTLVTSLKSSLQGELFELTFRTLIAQYKLVERDVSFADYTAALSEAKVQRYIQGTYPVLARQIDNSIARWLNNATMLIERFATDSLIIAAELLGTDRTVGIEKIRFGLGDAHRGGQSVAILELSGGHKIIYKPRSLAVDSHFAELVDLIGAGADIELRTPRLIARDGYGWVEFVAHQPCHDEGEADDYYRRLGAFLALLYVLEASDFHYENIIAHGAHPMLIDLETFFHPLTPIVGTETNEGIDNSVLHSGLLPNRISLGADRSIDVSGMTDVRGQEGLVDRLILSQDEQGRFSFRRDRGRLTGANNVPTLAGTNVRLTTRLRERFKAGFTAAYRYAFSNRPQLLIAISRFGGDEVRVLFRNTIVYTHLLDEARHPALLLSEGNLARHFATLKNLSQEFPLGVTLEPFETRCLQLRDVPMFTCRVGETDLIVDNDHRVPGFFIRNGLDIVRDKIAKLDESDLARQLWIIDKALELGNAVSAAAEEKSLVSQPSRSLVSKNNEGALTSLPERFREQASRIADYICGEIYEDYHHASWMVVKSVAEDNSKLTLHNAFYDFYAGMPGEIAYLIQIAKLSGKSTYSVTADKAYRFLQQRLAEAAYSIRPLGLFAGWGSVVLLQTALGIWRSDRAYFDDVEALLEQVDFGALIAVDRNFSLLKGAAGFGFACAEYHRVSGSRRAIELAVKAFDHLFEHQHDGATGLSWRIASAHPLSGLSHGASGFAAAFAKMFEVTGDVRYKTACLGVLKFERTLFVADEGNWLDRRDYVLRNGQTRCSISWAHGAPGIGIARVSIIKSGITSDQIVDDLHSAIESTLEAGLTSELAVVSGDFGRIELPLVFAETLGDQYLSKTRAVLATLVDKLETYTDRLGQKQNMPLGLLSGITGVGYQCLRIADNVKVPSLIGLSLESPLRRVSVCPN